MQVSLAATNNQHHTYDIMKTERIKEPWMSLSQREIDELEERFWEHYKNGGCLCCAYSQGECCCGAWWGDEDYED